MKYALSLLTVLCLSIYCNAQTVQQEIEEVTVESFFFEQLVTSSTSPVSVVTAKQLESIPLQSIGDALKLEPAVSITSDGTWATAPVIRGLSGQRVVVAVDGNRIETATDISGGMNMINMHDVEKIEIIKSGASSVYGSGAVGGVINFITQPIVYSTTPQFNTLISTSYQSANNLFDEYLKMSASKEKLFFSLSGSYRHANNMMTPAGKLQNSQFEDYSVNAKMGYRINDKHEIKASHQNFQARNVGIPGGASFNNQFTVTFPEHNRTMTDVQYHITELNEKLSLLKLKIYNQNINRDVHVNTNHPMYVGKPIMLEPSAQHQLWGGLVQTDFNLDRQKVSAGIDIWQRQLKSHRKKTISQADSSTIIRGESPLPNASYLSNGLFVQTERHFFNDRLNTTAGLRYDYIVVENDDVYDPVYMYKNGVKLSPAQRHTVEAGVEQKQSWSANIGANYAISKDLRIALSGGHSFRAPNIEELYKYIDLGSTVEIGNPDLNPEKSNFLDLGIHYNTEKISFTANGFINRIDDMISEELGEATYDKYDSDGNTVGTDTVEANVLNNLEEALLYGFDASIRYEAAPQLFVYGNIAYTVGRNLISEDYLPQIAPMHGLAGFKYNAYKHLQGDINCEWAAKQDKIASTETMTEAYAIVNVNLNSQQFDLGKAKLQAFAGVRNLFNTEYTNHLAVNRGLVKVEPGRNFYVKLKVSL